MELLKQLEVYAQQPTRKRMDGMSESYHRVVRQNLKEYTMLYSQFNRQTLQEFLIKKDCAYNTRFFLAYSLGKFLEWCGLITDGEYTRLKKAFPKAQHKYKDSYLTPSDVEKVLLVAWQSREQNHLRDACMIYIMATTGCRVSQLCDLVRKDIEVSDEGWTFYFNKKKQSVSASPVKHKLTIRQNHSIGKVSADDVITPILWEARNREALFITRENKAMTPNLVRESIKRYASKAQIGDITPHSFRYYVGEQVTRKYGIAVAKNVLDHCDIRMTDKYFNPNTINTSTIL